MSLPVSAMNSIRFAAAAIGSVIDTASQRAIARLEANMTDTPAAKRPKNLGEVHAVGAIEVTHTTTGANTATVSAAPTAAVRRHRSDAPLDTWQPLPLRPKKP